jgi:prepilin-type processing-associated H-X9-DG protein
MKLILSQRSNGSPTGPGRGFTLLELVAIVATLAVLASVVAPALAKARPNTHRYQCLNNLSQITSAMLMYAHDYTDFFPPNPDDPGDDMQGHHWVSNVNQGGSSAYDPSPLKDGAHSLITPYLANNITVYRCPSDTRQGPYSPASGYALDPTLVGKILPAVRSVSMSQAVGTVCDPYWSCQGGHFGPPRHPVNGPWLTGTHGGNGCSGNLTWSTFGKTSSFRTIGAAMVFILCDESPYSINDGALATTADPANPVFIDYPAAYHNGDSSFGFCDGHAELHKWKGNQIKITGPPGLQVPASANDLTDWTWLAQHSSARDH